VVNRCSCSQPIVWQASHLLHRYRLTGISMQECSSLCMFRNFHCSSSLLLNKDTSVRICTCNCKGMSPFSREKQTWRRGARASRVREGSSAEGGNIEGSGSLGCEEVGEANYADLFKASLQERAPRTCQIAISNQGPRSLFLASRPRDREERKPLGPHRV
jgi:hypothetical protein